MLSRPLKQQFATAIRRLLRPVVRQLITYGISYSTFSEMVKEVYVEVAETDFPLPFKRQTDSRLALVTGVNRKEISRLRRLRKTVRPSVEVEDTLATHVIGRWLGGPPYSDAGGSPRRLPYDSERANVPSFTRLVRSLSVDIPVRSILDELLRIGTVELLEDGDVQLVREAHIPADDLGGKLTLLGSDPAELFATISHNIEHPERPRLQRKVVYDNIGSEALAELRAAARKLGEEFVRKANQLVASYDRDRNPRAPGGHQARVVLGTYYFEEEAAPPPPSGKKAQQRPPGRIRRSQK
jgi:histone H3/H4